MHDYSRVYIYYDKLENTIYASEYPIDLATPAERFIKSFIVDDGAVDITTRVSICEDQLHKGIFAMECFEAHIHMYYHGFACWIGPEITRAVYTSLSSTRHYQVHIERHGACEYSLELRYTISTRPEDALDDKAVSWKIKLNNKRREMENDVNHARVKDLIVKMYNQDVSKLVEKIKNVSKKVSNVSNLSDLWPYLHGMKEEVKDASDSN